MHKLCIDCIHHRIINRSHVCIRNAKKVFSPVDGTQNYDSKRYCDDARALEPICGPDGKNFEAKPKLPLWKKIFNFIIQ